MSPTLSEYTAFLRSPVNISVTVLPDDSPSIATSFEVAKDIVNPVLCIASKGQYALAVYSLAADRLINFAPDQDRQTFFFDQRAKLRIYEPAVGVVASGGDGGTSMGLDNPEQLKRLTLGQLQNLKTFWGRNYLAIAQSYGVSLWGLS